VKPPVPVPLELAGPAGRLEALLEDPGAERPAAFAVICHPHPLHGGTMHNKVAATLARAMQEQGAPTLRFNFRGVGASEGTHDGGRGEVDDALAVIAEGHRRWPGAALWLAGFSFGGVVALRAAMRTPCSRLVTVAPALARYFGSGAEVPRPDCDWLLIQGDADEVLDPAEGLALARAVEPPPRIVVLPGVGHFFHGRLTELRDAVLAPA
jgi:alpha/beta superfamily hydrolase